SVGSSVHYIFGAVVGALYGAVAEIAPSATTALGLPFGAAVWFGAHVVAVPALGLAESPARRPLGKEAAEFGLHLVYGSVSEFGRRSLPRERGKDVPRSSKKMSRSTRGE